jgi:hypothetical protein
VLGRRFNGPGRNGSITASPEVRSSLVLQPVPGLPIRLPIRVRRRAADFVQLGLQVVAPLPKREQFIALVAMSVKRLATLSFRDEAANSGGRYRASRSTVNKRLLFGNSTITSGSFGEA